MKTYCSYCGDPDPTDKVKTQHGKETLVHWHCVNGFNDRERRRACVPVPAVTKKYPAQQPTGK